MPTLNYDRPISEAEYLRIEEAEPEKHEYVAGLMFEMVGASMAHNRIVTNLVRYLFEPVDASGCFLVSNTMKVKVETLGAIYYRGVVRKISRQC